MNLKIHFLSCALLTINPQGNFYKNINQFRLINNDIVVKGNQEVLDYHIELNKTSIKNTAKNILKPLTQTEDMNQLSNKQKTFQNLTIKSYLKKYKRNYYMFFYTNFNCSQKPLGDKTLNTFAIENLFLLAGL